MPNPSKLAAAALIVVAAWFGHAARAQSGQPAQTPPAPSETPAPPPITLPFAKLTPDATFEAAGDRTLLTTGDSVWVATRSGVALLRIDPKAGKITQSITLPGPPCGGLAEGFGAIWAPLCSTPPSVARVDTKTNAVAATISKGLTAIAGAPAVGVASVWLITDPKGTIGRFDPDGNTQVAELYPGAPIDALAFGQDALWASSAATNALLRLNPHTHVLVETIKVGKSPHALAIGEGAVWTINAADATVSRVDPKTNKVTTTIKLGVTMSGAQIAVGEGSVWVTASGTPLLRIDPRVNRVVQVFTGPGGGALAVGHGSLWITAAPTLVWRLDPRRIEATRS